MICSLATKVASVLGGAVVTMENYHDPSLFVDDNSDFDTIDFPQLIRNLEVLFSTQMRGQLCRPSPGTLYIYYLLTN